MKKLTLIIALTVATAALFAQGAPGAAPGRSGAEPSAFAKTASVSGTLVFVDDRPAIKTDSGTVYLAMPEFYKYAYLDGIKAGAAVKATGILVSAPAEPPAAQAPQPTAQGAIPSSASPSASASGKAPQSAETTIIAKEVTIGSKTYIIVGGGPGGFLGGERNGAGEGGKDRDPAQGEQDRRAGPEQSRK
jgi:hypothetical protein